jgi:hypothetical protein
MKTINLKEFTDSFMAISNNLTHAELRMLYLLITEPDVIKLSQQKFAEKIGTNRRTIWLGIEKLKKLNYISAIKTTDDQMTVDSDKNITKTQLEDSDTNITDSKVLVESDKDITKTQLEGSDINITDNKVIVDSDKNITKNQNEQGEIINDSTKYLIKMSMSRYDELINDFCVYQKHDVLIKLFEEFPDSYPRILSGVRDDLPPDINRLAKKYGFVDELRIIKISNKELRKLNKDEKYEYYDFLSFINKFWANQNKYVRRKIIRQYLIYHPFLIKTFIKSVEKATTENITELVEIRVKELYGIELSQLIQWSYR